MDKLKAWDFLVNNEIATDEELELVTAVAGFTLDTLCEVLDCKVGFRNFEQYKDYHLDIDDIELHKEVIKIDFDRAGTLDGLMSVLEWNNCYLLLVDTWYIEWVGNWYQVERKFHYSDKLSGEVHFYLINDTEQIAGLESCCFS